MFDYRGYTAEYLQKRCDQLRAFKGLSKRYYGQIEMYSIGRYYREETGYPTTLPFYVFSQHAGNQTGIMPSEINNDAEAMLVWNTDRQRAFQKVSDKPCYVVTCPYITRRKRLGLAQAPEAKGTLIFPAHSLKALETEYNVDRYIEEILALPPKFHPLAVCLYVADVRRGAHRRYMEKGLPVYSAGDMHDIYFADRLYEILRHFRYSMSNTVGSYAFYSVELGLPFSLWGEEAKYITGEAQASSRPHIADSLFAGFHTEISPEQKDFVEFSLGLGQGISSEELGRIFWAAYRKRGHRAADALTAARLATKRFFQKLRYGESL